MIQSTIIKITRSQRYARIYLPVRIALPLVMVLIMTCRSIVVQRYSTPSIATLVQNEEARIKVSAQAHERSISSDQVEVNGKTSVATRGVSPPYKFTFTGSDVPLQRQTESIGMTNFESIQAQQSKFASTTSIAKSWPIRNMTEVHCEGDDVLRSPTFIIAGAQKSGTTALYVLLSQHPHIYHSEKYEVHFFDRELGHLWDTDAAVASNDDICLKRKQYQSMFETEELAKFRAQSKRQRNHNLDDVAIFEKSPIYLAVPSAASFIKRIVPWTKILMILRNPVDRSYSSYKMLRDRKSNADRIDFPTFEECVITEIDNLRKLGLSNAPRYLDFKAAHGSGAFDDHHLYTIPQSLSERKLDVIEKTRPGYSYKIIRAMLPHLARGFYAQQLVHWFDHFSINNTMKVLQYERFDNNRPGVFQEILHFIDVDPSAWRENEKIFYEDLGPTVKKTESEMDPMVRKYLHLFYKPYNDELADLLGEEWRGVWDE